MARRLLDRQQSGSRLDGGDRTGLPARQGAVLAEEPFSEADLYVFAGLDLESVVVDADDWRLRSLVKQGFFQWTADDAAFVLAHASYPEQDRHKTKEGREHVEVIKTLMVREGWREHDQLGFAAWDDRIVMVNGHHRLSAQSLAGISVNWTIVVHQVSSFEDARRLYNQYDTNVRLRTNEQISKAIGTAERFGLKKMMAHALMNAVPMLHSGLDSSRKGRDLAVERVYDLREQVAQEYSEAALILEECFSGADKPLKAKLLSQGVLSVALVTARYQLVKAKAFWSVLAENDGIPKVDPRATFIRTVMAKDLGKNAWLGSAYASAAWNAWMRDEKPKYFAPGEPHPVRVIGTPFEKGRDHD